MDSGVNELIYIYIYLFIYLDVRRRICRVKI